MTINKSTGDPLSFDNDIAAEFGQGDYSLGQYRRDDPRFTNKNVGNLTNLPLDTGIPNNGEIKFSDFYGKKLNVIVNYYNGTQETRQSVGRATLAATHRYVNEPASSPMKVVGGFANAPSATVTGAGNDYLLSSTEWRGGRKIIVHVNKTIGGQAGGQRDRISLRTGRWPSGTTLQVDVGASGKIYGACGEGGGGSVNDTTGEDGKTGMSALGVEYAATINNSGLIRCGYGGGGGGSGAANDPTDKNDNDFGRAGGGGGGGAGLPAGAGGAGNLAGFGNYDESDGLPFDQRGQPGNAGGLNGGGAGGGAGNEGGANAGEGGDGGDFLLAAENGVKGIRADDRAYTDGPKNPGSGGTDGRAIYYRTTTIRNNSTVTGNTVGGRNGGQGVSIDIR